jgi:hypothetical protein
MSGLVGLLMVVHMGKHSNVLVLWGVVRRDQASRDVVADISSLCISATQT